MLMFLIGVRKNRAAPDLNTAMFDRYLPANPGSTSVLRSDETFAILFAYNHTRLDRHARQLEGGFALFDGIIAPSGRLDLEPDNAVDHVYESCFESSLSDRASIDGEYSIAWCKAGSVEAQSNIYSTNGLFTLETKDYTLISNKMSLLLGTPGYTAEVDPSYIRWMAYRGYASARGAPFAHIAQVPGGAKICISAEGELSIRLLRYSDLRDDDLRKRIHEAPSIAYQIEIERLAGYFKYAHNFWGELPIRVPLSGGKDSRVILSYIIRSGLMQNVEQIYTRGNHYSPEVLSAKEICRTVNFNEHTIRRPPYVSDAHVSPTTITNSTRLTDGMLSSYDFNGIDKSNYFVFQGHQLATRPGTFSDLNNEPYDAFIKTALERRARDPLNIIADRSDLDQESKIFFDEWISQGADVSELNDLYFIFDRAPSWIPHMNVASNIGSPISNPLVSNDFLKFVFNTPIEHRTAEIIHYLSLSSNCPSLIDIPFANQQWAPSQHDILARDFADIVSRRPFSRASPPYRSHRAFPNAANPFVGNVKLSLFKASGRLFRSLNGGELKILGKHIDIDKLIAAVYELERPKLSEIYVALAIITVVLIIRYDKKIFDREHFRAIVEDLGEIFTSNEPWILGKSMPDLNNFAENLLEIHEKCIAEFVVDRQRLEARMMG